MKRQDPPDRTDWARFSLRTLLAITLLAAAFFAGWVSHREWNRRNVDEAVKRASMRVRGPVQVETPKGVPDVLILRGKKNDVADMREVIQEIDAAVRK